MIKTRFVILVLVLITSNVFRVIGQDTTYFQQRLEEVQRTRHNDTLDLKYHFLKNSIEKRIVSEKPETPVYKALKEVQLYSLVGLINFNVRNKSSVDTVRHYLQVLEMLTDIPEHYLNSNILWLSDYFNRKGHFVEAVDGFERAFEYPWLSKDSNIASTALIGLANLYLNLKDPDMAWEVIQLLKEIEPSEDEGTRNRGRLLIIKLEAQTYALQGENEQSLASLEKIDIDSIATLQSWGLLWSYGSVKAQVYINLGQASEALKIVTLMADSLPTRIVRSSTLRLIQLQLANLNQETALASAYIDTLSNTGITSVNDRLLFLEANYKNEYNSKSYQMAFDTYTRYNDFKDSLNTVNFMHRGELLNYRVNKEKELVVLNQSNKAKDEIIAKNKTFYILVFITIIAVLLSGFVMIHFRKQKRQIKLEAELYKVREIADLKNNFLENLSHEIRTPITAISGYLNLLRKNTLNPSNILKYTDMAVRNCGLMISTLNNFLTLLKLEKTSFQSHSFEDIMSNRLLSLVSSFEPGARLKDVGLFYKSNLRAGVKLSYQYDFLDKILNNLVSNALKYTNSQKNIYVNVTLEPTELILTIKDEGIGIDSEELELIFDRFYQSEQHQLIGGFGIGLSLVDELVKKLNGEILVRSEVEIGSEFNIKLPHDFVNHTLYVKELDEGFKCLTAKDKTQVHQNGGLNLPKVLIVDDNTEMIAYLNELLSADLQCKFAFNGMEGLKKAKETDFDLIISDLRMPVMNGIQFKQTLNKMKEYKDIPFIILSASTMEITNEVQLDLGVSDYIQKPFSDEEILARIRFLLENKVYRKKLYSMEGEKVDFHASHSELVEKVKGAVLENVSNFGFSVKELADICGHSQNQLNNIIQLKTGLSLVKIILEIRLLKAHDLITAGKYQTISEVVYAIGLNSRPYFYKRFQERFGIKAGELLKKNLGIA